ncbi:MAG: alpha/beta hydrolase-fold protein [Bacteroidota bacterium]
MKFVKLALILLIFSIKANAQQDLIRQNTNISSELNANNTITFRLRATIAKSVSVSGTWMKSEGFKRPFKELIMGADSVWTYTTEVLPSDMYLYSFTVDGIRTIDPSNAHVIRDVASISNVFIVGGEHGDLYKVNKVPHGTVAKRWYDSPKIGKTRRVTIYTPAGYEISQKEYPVLYLMHGIGGDEEAWTGSGKAAQILDNLIAQGKVVPMIVVMTNGNVAMEAAPSEGSEGYTRPTFMLPNTMDGKFEESFVDIMKFVESNYRTIAKKEGRAIAGLSMGGYHTAYISQNYPNTFDYMGLFSPAMNNKPEAHPESPAYQDLDTKLKNQKKNGYKLYWIAVGKTDMGILLDGIQEYRKKMDTIGMKYDFKFTEGGHTWTNWRDYLQEFAQKLFK